MTTGIPIRQPIAGDLSFNKRLYFVTNGVVIGYINKYKLEQEGEKVAIIALGDFYQRGKKVAENIKEKLGFKPTLINPRFATGLDTKLLNKLNFVYNMSINKIIITKKRGKYYE